MLCFKTLRVILKSISVQFFAEDFFEKFGIQIVALLIVVDTIVDKNIFAGKRLVIVHVHIVTVWSVIYKFAQKLVAFEGSGGTIRELIAGVKRVADIDVNVGEIGKRIGNHALSKLPCFLNRITKCCVIAEGEIYKHLRLKRAHHTGVVI